MLLGYRSNQPKSRSAEMGTTCLLRQICNNKTKKKFTRVRTRTIDNSVTVRQCTGSSTTSPIRLSRKKGISEQFSNHCFETRYLFKSTGGWLEHMLGLHGILLGCSWVTGATNQSKGTPKWAQHACCGKFAIIRPI